MFLYIYWWNHSVGRVLNFFSSRRNWDSPYPSPAGECKGGGRGTLAGERWGGRVPIPTRGHTLWYSVQCTYTYFGVELNTSFKSFLSGSQMSHPREKDNQFLFLPLGKVFCKVSQVSRPNRGAYHSLGMSRLVSHLVC
jgi:hypothetical protein